LIAALLGGCGGGFNCDLQGIWQGTLPGGPAAGETTNWGFKGDGTSVAGIGYFADVFGTWSVDSHTLTLTDTSAVPPEAACPGSATYGLTFGNDCHTVVLSAKSDACDGRRQSLDGLAMIRN
jgi:hypothetical protein